MANLVAYDDSDSEESPASAEATSSVALGRIKNENEKPLGIVVSSNDCQASSSWSSSIKDRFVDMGYSSAIVEKAIQIHGTGNEEDILEYVLACQVTEQSLDSSGGDSLGDSERSEFEDANSFVENQVKDNDHDLADQSQNIKEMLSDDSFAHKTRVHLLEMGYSEDEVSSAIKICGTDAPADELVDFIGAHFHQIERNDDVEVPNSENQDKGKGLMEEDERAHASKFRKRKKTCIILNGFKRDDSSIQRKTSRTRNNKALKNSERMNRVESKQASLVDEHVILPDPYLRRLTGYGIPGCLPERSKEMNEFMRGPPYFYFENVATMPKAVWKTISRHFNDVEPEFVDCKYFSACTRPRGYVHNLPIDGRFQPLPLPPMTIQDALPQTQRYWPSWDNRTKMNCISPLRASDVICQNLRSIIKNSRGRPSLSEQVDIIDNCKKWNLVWIGPDQMAPLEPHEIELLLGYERDHTRGVSSRTDRLQYLGNAFQTDTVGYHLSSLKPFYSDGIKILSLFSGIGGAEVALNRVGIYLKCVVSVEICTQRRHILRSWWQKTQQTGRLIEKEDVQQLTNETMEELVEEIGGFDLIIGGCTCKIPSSNDENSKDGLEERQSSVFYEFPRILNVVRQIMRSKGMV